jgi:hypothetical protein
LTSDLGNLSFEMRKLFFHQKWVMALFSQLRDAVEVFLSCHSIGLGTKSTISITLPNPKVTRRIGKPVKIKPWDVVM